MANRECKDFATGVAISRLPTSLLLDRGWILVEAATRQASPCRQPCRTLLSCGPADAGIRFTRVSSPAKLPLEHRAAYRYLTKHVLFLEDLFVRRCHEMSFHRVFSEKTVCVTFESASCDAHGCRWPGPCSRQEAEYPGHLVTTSAPGTSAITIGAPWATGRPILTGLRTRACCLPTITANRAVRPSRRVPAATCRSHRNDEGRPTRRKEGCKRQMSRLARS